MTNPNLLTRREFIVNSSLSLLGIALASCTTPPPPQQPQGALRPPATVVPLPSPDLTADVISRRRQENKKGIPGLDSKPIMSEQDFKRIDGGLKTSPSKLFQIIGNGLQNLWEGKRDQSLFPESVYDKDLSPLVITYDTDSGSFCSLVAQNGDKNEFIFTIDGNKIYRPPVKPFKMGIALGSQVEMRKEGTTPEEFYLAKEAINLFAMPPITSQTARVLRSIYNYTSTDMNGKAIDPNDEQKAGAAFYIAMASDLQGTFWKLIDGFPIALVGTQLETLLTAIPGLERSHSLTPFVIASELLKFPQYKGAKIAVESFVDTWVKSNSPVPPANYLDCMLNPDVGNYILAVQNKIVELAQKK